VQLFWHSIPTMAAILKEPPSGMGANVLIRYFLDTRQGKILREMGKKGISKEEFQAVMALESAPKERNRTNYN